MHFVDTHSHLFSAEFNHDRSEVIDRAKAAGVKYVVLPNVDSSTIESMLSTAQQYPHFCFPAMGIHPTSVKDNFEDELAIVENYLRTQKFYAVGEIGIDLYWDKTHLEEQKVAFRRQLKLAKELSLPVIIHSRNSFEEIFKIVDVENDSNLRGVFHSFTGTLEQYNHIKSYGGFFVGIGGVVTYKHGGVDKVVGYMDTKNILLETDSPYLSPVPHRGKRNESANIVPVAHKVAELLSLSIDEVAEITSKNAHSLFSIEP